MKDRSLPRWTLAAILLLLVAPTITMAQEAPIPGTVAEPPAASEVFLETSPPASPGVHAAVRELLVEGEASEIDLSLVPTAEELGLAVPDPFGEDSFHIQGEFIQHLEGGPGEPSAGIMDLVTGTVAELAESPSPSENDPLPNATGSNVVAFGGQGFTGWIPPDTVHAIGPNHVVMAVNSGFTVYSRLGTVMRSYTTFDSFLHKPSPWASGSIMFDPRILYDQTRNRFVMLVLGRDSVNDRSYVWTASSTDPTGGWFLLRFNVTRNQDTASEAWLDYAGLGFDANGLYWTGNYFRWSGGFDTAIVATLGPRAITGASSGNLTATIYSGLSWPSGGSAFSLQPAIPHNANSQNQVFFVNTGSASGSKILLWRFSGDRYTGQGLGTPVLSRAEVSLGKTYYGIFNNVDQAGSTTDIDGGDARVMNAIYQNRRVYAVLTDAVGTSGTRSGIYTIKLDTNGNSVSAQHTLWTTNAYRFYPAVTVDAVGGSQNPEVAVFYNWVYAAATNNAKYVSGARKIYTTFPTSTGLDSIVVYGGGPYRRLDGGGRNRWGDYSGAQFDWSCNAVSGSLEYAGSTALPNVWKTWFRMDEIGHGPCPMIEVTSPNGGETWNAGTTKTITWKRVDLTSSGHETRIYFYPNYPSATGSSLVATLAPTASSYGWSVPGTPTTTGRIWVGNTPGTGWEAGDWGDANFKVTAPNLVVINPKVSKTSLTTGEVFTLGATVQNSGNGSSNVSTVLRYRLSTNSTISTSDPVIGTDAVGVLGPGATSVESAAVSVGSPGNYWVGACVDPVKGETSATSITNCSSGIAITVTGAGPVDDLVVANQVITGTKTFEACNSITLGPNLTIGNSVTIFRSPIISVTNEVTWNTDADSSIYNDKPVGCP